jgi:hypothetical protein
MFTRNQVIEILKSIEPDYSEYPFYGVRFQDELYGLEVGDKITHKSNIWDDGNMTDETLDAVCAVMFDMAAKGKSICYDGDYMLVLASHSAIDGNDYGEIEMEYPIVLSIHI